jgi:histidyl-tRNA synthetase
MQFQAVKGTRDFYPENMRLRNWIADAWRRVSLRNGFEEFDSPIFEYLDLFTAKSGQEIAEQLFSLTDRGGRQLAIRPEITPALARMVNARINALPRPIKWFSIPRLCRAENPQKGRLREFFQWNVDVIGADDVQADGECVFTCVDLLRELGLGPGDAQVRIGSRALVTAALDAIGASPEARDKALPVLDRRRKIDPDSFRQQVLAAGLTDEQFGRIESVLSAESIDQARRLVTDGAAASALDELDRLWGVLRAMGVAESCRLDLSVVRGLAYYTGIVYEAFDAGQSLRALAGGGRYDNLLEVLGGPKVGACGFGMGDVVLGILLEEKGKLPPELRTRRVEFFVIDGEPAQRQAVLETVARLRQAGQSAEFSYKADSLGKQLKEANRRGARQAIIVKPQGLAVKDLTTGQQRDVTLDELLSAARA